MLPLRKSLMLYPKNMIPETNFVPLVLPEGLVIPVLVEPMLSRDLCQLNSPPRTGTPVTYLAHPVQQVVAVVILQDLRDTRILPRWVAELAPSTVATGGRWVSSAGAASKEAFRSLVRPQAMNRLNTDRLAIVNFQQ